MGAEGAAARPVTVLVTRPEGPAADALCSALRERGYRPLAQPLLMLEPVAELSSAGRDSLRELDRFQHVIFVSGNAVRLGMDRIRLAWPRFPAAPRCYAVGDATAGLLREYGLSPLTPGARMSSEGLLALPELADVAGQRVLIVKGEGGRDALRSELTRRGARVEELVCYRRRPVAPPPQGLAALLREHRVEAVLISSGEGMGRLQELLTPGESSNFETLCLVVPSERVAELARDAGFGRTIVAENASDTAMLRALEDWKSRHGE